MAWCSAKNKAQGQLYLYLYITLHNVLKDKVLQNLHKTSKQRFIEIFFWGGGVKMLSVWERSAPNLRKSSSGLRFGSDYSHTVEELRAEIEFIIAITDENALAATVRCPDLRYYKCSMIINNIHTFRFFKRRTLRTIMTFLGYAGQHLKF
jgi:hypothetical protein